MKNTPNEASKSVDAISRILAVLVLFIGAPSLLGVFLDQKLGTMWITPVAVVLGTFVALGALLLVIKKMELDEPKMDRTKLKSAEEMAEEEARWKEKGKGSDPIRREESP